MNKHFAAVGLVLISSVSASYMFATYLLSESLLFAIALYALCFSGGVWLLPVSRGAFVHACSLGVGMGLVGAFLFSLPSASFA